MGQYFKLINVDKNEVCALPGGLKLPEIMSNDMAGSVLTYLMFEGPFDGTTLLDQLYTEDDPKVQETIEERIEAEKEREKQRRNSSEPKERYLSQAIRRTEDHPFEQDDADISNLQKFPQQVIDKYEELFEERTRSTYRNDDGSWNRDRLKRVVCAGFKTGEDALCGRWAGDEVTIIGDYADRELYDAMYGTVVVRLDNGELAEWVGPHPEAEEPVPSDGPGVRARLLDRDAQPGDQVRARSSLDCGQDHVEFVEYKENEWDTITASVYSEMARYMPDKFGELEDKIDESEVDIVFGSGRNAR